MKKYFSIFLVLIIALSSVGMSVSQHLCTMSKEEIEASACDMCASEHRGEADAGEPGENSCCSEESVHLKVDTDATSARTPEAPQPLSTVSRPSLLLHAVATAELTDLARTADRWLATFPTSEEHTILRL